MTHRNGYRPRAWETRVGEIELLIPRKRQGPAYFPSFLGAAPALGAGDRRGRDGGLCERRLDAEGRPARRAARDRGDDQGPRLGALPGLDEQVELFRQRPLEGAYPYLWLDAKHVKVRDHGRVVSKALVVAYAVHESGVREVIGLDIGEVESGSFWVEFLRVAQEARPVRRQARRLRPARRAQGRDRARAGCPWQRCTVHFVRDMLAHCRRDQRGLVSAALREVFNAEDRDQARDRVDARPRAASSRSRRRSAGCSKKPRRT